MDRQEYKSKAPWEDKLGYCRAVRVGDYVEVAGTTAVNEKGEVMGHTYFEQTKYILNKIEKSLNALNCPKNDIVRTRIYVLDISKWEEVAKAHSAFFTDTKPVCTLIEVAKFIEPNLIIEIEVTAINNQ